MKPNQLREQTLDLAVELAKRADIDSQTREMIRAAKAIDEQFRELRNLCNPQSRVATIVLDKVEESEFGAGLIEADIEDIYEFITHSGSYYKATMSTIKSKRDFDSYTWTDRLTTHGSLVSYFFRVGRDISQRFQIGESEVFGPGSPAEDGQFLLWKIPAPDAPIDKLDERVDMTQADLQAMIIQATDTIGYLVNRATDTNLNPEIAERVQQHYSGQSDDSAETVAKTQA